MLGIGLDEKKDIISLHQYIKEGDEGNIMKLLKSLKKIDKKYFNYLLKYHELCESFTKKR